MVEQIYVNFDLISVIIGYMMKIYLFDSTLDLTVRLLYA
ncbi:hypothetical protein Anacy_4249 [Anabaena cylindrica PCC 7122]|uniref:Uncharacterized protein n=1 Tax=Anabaena cylindrica (strain ATCC 27899 / PCC 7122) TaxID=272123 RepID=K9ZK43_ANACC|nr:hypothetical protein Anacy_4249 [Anabaena cylindrica PCC 7122]BAY03341.1 hypothetical protein NIES19_25940 [Anabaena cylindrica PCC 7122]